MGSSLQRAGVGRLSGPFEANEANEAKLEFFDSFEAE